MMVGFARGSRGGGKTPSNGYRLDSGPMHCFLYNSVRVLSCLLASVRERFTWCCTVVAWSCKCEQGWNVELWKPNVNCDFIPIPMLDELDLKNFTVYYGWESWSSTQPYHYPCCHVGTIIKIHMTFMTFYLNSNDCQ